MKRGQKLNALLRDWAAETQPDEETKKRLRKEVCESLRCTRIPRTMFSEGRVRTSQGNLTALRWAPAAAAIVLVAGLALFFAQTPPPSRSESNDQGLGAPADESLPLFEEVSRLFENRLHWAVETGSGLHLNIDQLRTKGGGCGTALLVETVVLTEGAAGAWRQIWKARALTCPDELIEAPTNGNARSKMLQWTHRLPDGNLAVETELSLSESSFSGSFDGILVPGEAKAVATLRQDGRVYRVQQRVRPFPAKEEA
ncbi:MAG: hypothetical protein ACOCUY_00675 [Verrucomicrobiota bacterium]